MACSVASGHQRRSWLRDDGPGASSAPQGDRRCSRSESDPVHGRRLFREYVPRRAAHHAGSGSRHRVDSLQRLVSELDPSEFYVDADTARDALDRRTMFNVIEMATAWK